MILQLVWTDLRRRVPATDARVRANDSCFLGSVSLVLSRSRFPCSLPTPLQRKKISLDLKELIQIRVRATFKVTLINPTCPISIDSVWDYGSYGISVTCKWPADPQALSKEHFAFMCKSVKTLRQLNYHKCSLCSDVKIYIFTLLFKIPFRWHRQCQHRVIVFPYFKSHQGQSVSDWWVLMVLLSQSHRIPFSSELINNTPPQISSINKGNDHDHHSRHNQQ